LDEGKTQTEMAKR
jgi:hypothetical protein